jgi:hypothetical protein
MPRENAEGQRRWLSQCIAAAEGGIDGFWLIIAADLKVANTFVVPFNVIVRLAAFAKASASHYQISLGEALA